MNNSEKSNKINNFLYTSLLWFFILWFIFVVAGYIYSTRYISESKNIYIVSIVFLVVSFILQTIFSINYSDANDKPEEVFKIIGSNVISYGLISGLFLFLLSLFNGWVKVFSGTIGNAIFSGKIKELVTELKKDHNVNNEILLFYNNPDPLLNELDINSITNNSIIKSYFKVDTIKINELKNVLIVKEYVSIMCWNLLIGFFTILTTVNTIVNENF